LFAVLAARACTWQVRAFTPGQAWLMTMTWSR